MARGRRIPQGSLGNLCRDLSAPVGMGRAALAGEDPGRFGIAAGRAKAVVNARLLSLDRFKVCLGWCMGNGCCSERV